MPNGTWDGTLPSFAELKTRGDATMETSRELIAMLQESLNEHHRVHERFVESHLGYEEFLARAARVA